MRLSASRVTAMAVISTLAVAVAIPLAAAQRNLANAAGTWTIVWTASFAGAAGTGVNTAYWKYDLGRGIFGTGEVQAATDSVMNVHLNGNGALDITALDQGGEWTSGRIQTKSADFAAPADGELTVSASIEQPDAAPGAGYWPAFWLLGPGQWPEHGEIDIMEDVNSLSEHSGALHCGNLTAVNGDGTTGPCHEHTGLSSGLRPCSGCQTGYHVYSVTIDRRDASDQEIRWYLDNREFYSVDESRVGKAAWKKAFDHGFSIILDLAIGGSYPDSRCDCYTPTARTAPGGTMSIRDLQVSKWTPS